MQLVPHNFYLKNQVSLKSIFLDLKNFYFFEKKKEGNSIIVHVNAIYSDF